LLRQIPSESCYSSEAKQLLIGIEADQCLDGARGLYRKGDLDAALREIQERQDEGKTNGDLVAFKTLLQKIRAWHEQIKAAQGTIAGGNLEGLLGLSVICSNLMAADSNPSNEITSQALTIQNQVTQHLAFIAREKIGQAQLNLNKGGEFLAKDDFHDLLRPGIQRQGVHIKEAYQLCLEASRADPANQTARELSTLTSNKIWSACAVLYLSASKLQEPRNGDKSKANECYKAIVAIGLPGESIYERAKKKLEY
jgi:hypothetical protein